MFDPKHLLSLFVLLAFFALLCVFGLLSSPMFNSGISISPFSGEKYSVVGFESDNIEEIELIEVNNKSYYVFEVILKNKKLSPAFFEKEIKAGEMLVDKFLFDGKNLKINIIGNERSNFRETVPYHFLNEVIEGAKWAYSNRVSSLKLAEKMSKDNFVKLEKVNND